MWHPPLSQRAPQPHFQTLRIIVRMKQSWENCDLFITISNRCCVSNNTKCLMEESITLTLLPCHPNGRIWVNLSHKSDFLKYHYRRRDCFPESARDIFFHTILGHYLMVVILRVIVGCWRTGKMCHSFETFLRVVVFQSYALQSKGCEYSRPSSIAVNWFQTLPR